ncbi:MAG: metallophosphoesterase [Humibacillus sp.]|nr:metallophosphoesterase [Humibacillus sp.]MDN5779846.1 metallophosphoesterase [Humibacillus sp.]
MSFFVIGVAVVLALFSLLIYRRLAVAPGWPAAVRRVIAASLGLAAVATMVAFAMQSGVIDPHRARWAAWAGMTWLAVGWYLLLGALVLGLLSLVARAVGGRAARRRALRIGTPLVVVAALATTAYGLHEAADPQITTATFSSRQLPAQFDGLRVALISDLHVGPVREESFTRRVVDEVNAQRPDLVVLAGDLIDGRVEQVAGATDPLRDLRAPLGVMAVSGNHEVLSQEADAWLDHYRSLGITVLRNSSVELTRAGASIAVAGLNDETSAGDDAPNVGTSLAGITPDAFTLLVTHQPKAAESAAGRGVDLQLSGHTHGGQLWPFRYAVTLQQPALDGLTTVGDVPVFTTRGAGAWGPPVRVLAPPQVPIITLRRG